VLLLRVGPRRRGRPGWPRGIHAASELASSLTRPAGAGAGASGERAVSWRSVETRGTSSVRVGSRWGCGWESDAAGGIGAEGVGERGKGGELNAAASEPR
jgi:hypothetical protein